MDSASPRKVLTNGKHTVQSIDPALKSAVNAALLEGGYIPQMQSHLSSLLLTPLPPSSTSSSTTQNNSQQHTLSSLITSLTLEKLRAGMDESSSSSSNSNNTPPTYPNLMNSVRKDVKSQIPPELRKEMIEYVRSVLEEVVEVRVDSR